MPLNYSQSYFPVLVQMAIAIALAAGLIGASSLLGKRARSPLKDTPYESGMAPVGSARERFSVKFYLVGMIFILFDIEAVFLYPWAVVYRDLKMFAFGEMFVFVALVMVGFFYVWKKGALDWAADKGMSAGELAEGATDRAAHDAVMDATEKDNAGVNQA
jgi:NADH-quinone oxidoreductase subunit A